MMIIPTHRDRSIHIERECLAVFTFAKLGCFVRQICLSKQNRVSEQSTYLKILNLCTDIVHTQL